METNLIRFLKGYVKVRVTGSEFERLINLLVERRIPVWNIRRTGVERGEFHIHLQGYFRLKPFLKQTSCRIRTTERRGFPFVLAEIGKRKWFAAGAVAFVIGLYMLSQVVWEVRVEGNERIPEERILAEAARTGLHPLQWKWRLASPGLLADELSRALPDAAWVGVEMTGGKALVRIVEAVLPEKRVPQSPRHIVAAADGVITRIIANRGVPVVDVHTRVKRGDILISGILGDESRKEVVVAEGEVRGLVWYEYTVRTPLIDRYDAMTGATQSKLYAVLGNRALQLTGYRDKPFEREEVAVERSQLALGPWKLPIGWMTATHRETTPIERSKSIEEAREEGMAAARAEVAAAAGSDAVIKGEKVLHERTDNGKLILHVLFEAEVNLAAERAILAEELQPPAQDGTRP